MGLGDLEGPLQLSLCTQGGTLLWEGGRGAVLSILLLAARPGGTQGRTVWGAECGQG